MHNEGPRAQQRRLRFDDEELWTALPESVQQQCRLLLRQILATILNPKVRRENDGEN